MERLLRLLPPLWCGVLLTIGGIAAPALFALLPAADAGRVAGRLFATEAYVALALSIVLFIGERGRTRRPGADGRSALSGELLLVLGALFCTVAGYFALQPMMAQARAGGGRFGFGTLHAASSVLFLLKGLLVLALSWRVAGRPGR